MFDPLEMLATGDPVAKIDAALADAVTRLRLARSERDTRAVARLIGWIDQRLDQRLDFCTDGGPRRPDDRRPTAATT